MLRSLTWIAALLLCAASGAKADSVSTFTLDALSFISFGSDEVVLLPAGSTIKFRFGTPAPDGSVSFTIQPADISIPPVHLPNGQGTLEYAMGSTAAGNMQPDQDGKRISFNATVRATLTTTAGTGSYDYAMPFSTSGGSATSLDGSETLTRTGIHLVDGVWYGQIVGTTTNKANAFPEPGAAVYTVLSGSFDSVP